MSNATATRKVTEQHRNFAELMEEVATLEPAQQEKLAFYVQGYVTAATMNARNKAAIN